MSATDPDVKMKILLAAKKLFAKQGFDGTSVRQICDEAGANVALVSYHFGGKDNVFVALFKTFFPGNRMEAYEPYFHDPIIGIKKLVEEVTRFRLNDPDLVMIIQQEIFKQSARVETIQQNIFPVWLKVRELLERGRETGVFQFRSLDNTMFFVMGTLLFHKNTDYFLPILSDGVPTFDNMYRDAAVFILRGLGVPEKAEDYL
ncbi:TetR/AcrR family transcriptional regulator [Paenibacillus hemerocallicola]|uniref:TetR/AcrR family transcriptional regulator n=1 Tax=Paenibacillus hemerocallicola TaxID=1172614 RepID=A0A5C4T1Y7_9BACL|nr:TetR family transcriptional regulator [Paenibacillus hemerocallicola]TNJ62287.1 TetR/AcrR family transcriptional regulator [Paenibacillus hemerocallicola]